MGSNRGWLAKVSHEWKTLLPLPALLSVLMAQSLWFASVHTVTFDELVYIPASYSLWRTGDFRLVPEHPPLVLRWAALALLPVNPEFPLGTEWEFADRWRWGQRFLFESSNNADRLIFLARLPLIALSVGLGLSVFFAARNWFGNPAAWGALICYVLCPNITAHGSLVTFDVPHTLFFFLLFYTTWRAIERLTIARGLAVALSLAGTVLTKFTFPLVVPPLLVIGAVVVLSSRAVAVVLRLGKRSFNRSLEGRREKLIAVMALALSAVAICYGLIWVAYGFKYNSFPESVSSLENWRYFSCPPWADWALDQCERLRLLPKAFLIGLRDTFRKSTMEHPTYFLGEGRTTGHPFFFLACLLWKTPPATLLATLAGLVLFIRKYRRSLLSVFFLVPPLYWLLHFSLLTHFQLGLRYILPIYPFLFCLAGIALGHFWASRRLRWVTLILAGSLGGSNFWCAPHYLAYFNSLRLGARPADLLGDSNLDWGQDLKLLAGFQKEHHLPEIHLSYHGNGDPGYYGIRFAPLPVTSHYYPLPSAVAPLQETFPGQWVAISVTNLQGFLFHSWGFEPYLYFKKLKPDDLLGGTIAVFRLSSQVRQKSLAELCEAAYQEILLEQPENARAWLGLGALYLRWPGRLPDSVDALKKAVQWGPHEPLNFYYLALAVSRQGDPQEAISFLEQGIRLDPRRPEFFYNLGVAYQRLEQWERALAAYQQTLSLNPNHFEAHMNAGILEARRGHLTRAEFHFRRANQIRPADGEAWKHLASVLEELGKTAEAAISREHAGQPLE